MKNSIFTIMKKELARFFGDRRMAITTILLPGLMIYVIYSFMGSAIMDNFGPDKEYKAKVSAVNMPESLKEMFGALNFELDEISADKAEGVKKDIEEGDADLCVVFPEDFDSAVTGYDSVTAGRAAPNIEIYYNSSDADSQAAFSTVTAALDSYESAMTNKFDINNSEAKYDLATDEDISAQIFSSMLPMLLMIFMFSGCMAVAPESIAGEKERGTIATLLITPTKRSYIALGKIFALSLIAVLSGASSTIGTVLSLPKLMGAAEGAVKNVYGVLDYVWLGVVILSTVLLLVTAVSIISAFAKTIKEAQGYVSPLMILTMLVGVTAMFGGGIKTDLFYYFIPLYNSVQCMSGIFSFEIQPIHLIITVASNICYAGLGTVLLAKMFNSERIVFSK